MTNRSFSAALVQLCGSRNIQENIEVVDGLVREAAAQGADYVLTPENTTLMELDSGKVFEQLEPEHNNPHIQHFSALANGLKLWLHIGSMGIKLDDGRIANRSFLFRPDGVIAARYDKVHMFDVDLPDGESYRESQNFAPGHKAVVTDFPLAGKEEGKAGGKLGMSICYDLRFPTFYRAMAQAGADFLTVPAAFTRMTGEAHWHILLRARAIENGCFVFAAAQGGKHENGRETFGHSMIIDPWGKILAEGGTNPAVIMATIDPEQITTVRAQLPVLNHECSFVL